MATDLRRDFTSLNSEITVLKRKTPQERQEGLKPLKTKLKRIANSVSMFQYQIDDEATMVNVDSFRSQLVEFKNTLQKLDNDLNLVNSESYSQEELFKGATGVTTEKRAETGERKAVIQLGK